MFKKIVMLLSTLAFGSLMLTGCNTVQGVGRDVEKGGQKLQEEAVEHKKY
jgi:predicted small secreted protein